MANKHKTDREFAIGDFVYLKLQPHRQVTVKHGAYNKLSTRYYGPFEIETRIGKVAYRLKLPMTAAIHIVFHVSQLKLCHGVPPASPVLPVPIPATPTFRVPLDRRLGKRNGRPMMMILVQWSNGSSDEAT